MSSDQHSPGTTPSARAAAHRRNWRVLALAALVATGAGWWLSSRRVSPVHYATAPVTLGAIARAVTASGTVNPVVTVQVGSYVSGVIVSVSCDYNTHVTKGQVCAKIDPRPYQTVVEEDRANLAAARAQLVRDQATLSYAQATYRRNADLASRGIVSQDVVDQAKSTADQTQAQVQLDRTAIEQRQAALDAANVNLSYTTIVSPVDGVVVSRNVTTGQTVAASFQTPTLFLIASDLTRMQVDTNVSESDIGGIGQGERAYFTVAAYPDRSFDGTVVQVRQAPQTVQNVVTYDVVVGVPNPERLLKPGMTATVHVVTEERRDVVRVPDEAVRFTPGGLAAGSAAPIRPVGTTGGTGTSEASVWVLRDGRPVRVPVTIGLDDGTHAQVVKGGLQPGDRVIVSEQAGGASGQDTGPASRPRLRF